MTYNQQLDDYKKAVLTKKLAEMSPEERDRIFAEVAEENQLAHQTSLKAVKDE